MTNLPVLVDGLDDQVLTHYGKVPNGCYVIGADGNLIFRGAGGFQKVEHIIDALLNGTAWDGRRISMRNGCDLPDLTLNGTAWNAKC